MNRFLVYFVLATVTLLGVRVLARESVHTAQPAPGFALKDMAGRDAKLSDFDGKAVIVVFFLSGDELCRKQISTLLELQKDFATNEFVLIGLSLDSTPAAELQEFARKQKIEFPILLADYKVVGDYGGLDAVPTTFVIDKNHNIIHKRVGVTEKAVFEDDLRAIFKK